MFSTKLQDLRMYGKTPVVHWKYFVHWKYYRLHLSLIMGLAFCAIPECVDNVWCKTLLLFNTAFIGCFVDSPGHQNSGRGNVYLENNCHPSWAFLGLLLRQWLAIKLTFVEMWSLFLLTLRIRETSDLSVVLQIHINMWWSGWRSQMDLVTP